MPALAVAALLVFFILAAAALLYTLVAIWPDEGTTNVGTGTGGDGGDTAGGAGQAADASAGQSSVPVRLLMFTFTLTDEEALFLLVAVSGALGGIVHSLRSFGWYVGHRDLRVSWVPFYVLLPFVGATAATVFYVIARGGLFSPATQESAVNPFGFAAVSALVGLFSEQALVKLRDVARTVFSDVEPGADHYADQAGAFAVTAGEANVTATSATLRGRVSAGSASGVWRFEYGLTDQYGSVTPDRTLDPGSTFDVSEEVTGLQPNTTYHYRLVASGGSGSGAGTDRTFMTLP